MFQFDNKDIKKFPTWITPVSVIMILCILCSMIVSFFYLKFTDTLYINLTVKANSEIIHQSLPFNYKVEAQYFKDSAKVKKGQPLLKLISTTFSVNKGLAINKEIIIAALNDGTILKTINNDDLICSCPNDLFILIPKATPYTIFSNVSTKANNIFIGKKAVLTLGKYENVNGTIVNVTSLDQNFKRIIIKLDNAKQIDYEDIYMVKGSGRIILGEHNLFQKIISKSY